MLYTRVPLRVRGFGRFEMFETYEEGEGKEGRRGGRKGQNERIPLNISTIRVP